MTYMKFNFQFYRGDLKGANIPGEISNNSDFNEIKIILLMFTESRDLYLGVYIDFVICKWKKCWTTYFNYLLIWQLETGKSAEPHISTIYWFDNWKLGKVLNHIFQLFTDLTIGNWEKCWTTYFNYLLIWQLETGKSAEPHISTIYWFDNWKLGKVLNHIFQLFTDLTIGNWEKCWTTYFNYLLIWQLETGKSAESHISNFNWSDKSLCFRV